MTYSIEAAIERRLKQDAEAMGGTALKLILQGQAGWPDRTVLLPGGRVLFAECKRPGGVATPLQASWLRRLSRLGFAVGVYDGSQPLSSAIPTIEPIP